MFTLIQKGSSENERKKKWLRKDLR
jgi:hypothetical protein